MNFRKKCFVVVFCSVFVHTIENTQSDFIPTTVFERWNTYQAQRDSANNCLVIQRPTLSPVQIPSLTFPPSPTPSIDTYTNNSSNNSCSIIQNERSPITSYHLYPPSPPDSNGAPSPVACQFSVDLSMSDQAYSNPADSFDAPKKDYQLLREHLQDLSFQKKHNLKPLPLESLFADDWDVQDDIEPVISLALEQARKDVEQTCLTLNISSGELIISCVFASNNCMCLRGFFNSMQFNSIYRPARMELRSGACMASIHN